MKPLSQIPTTRPAASQRFPNRKPRKRRHLISTTQVRRKRRVIEGIQQGGLTLAEVGEIIGFSPAQIRDWGDHDAQFKQDLEKAIEGMKLAVKTMLAGQLRPAGDVVKQTIAGEQTSPLRFKAAAENIRGLGVWNEGPGVNVAVGVQVNEPPKIVEIRPNEGGQPYRELVKE